MRPRAHTHTPQIGFHSKLRYDLGPNCTHNMAFSTGLLELASLVHGRLGLATYIWIFSDPTQVGWFVLRSVSLIVKHCLQALRSVELGQHVMVVANLV